jgi:hypothetical protein
VCLYDKSKKIVGNSKAHKNFLRKCLLMGQTSVPETLVIYQKLTPGYNPKTFKQHYDHGGSLQLQGLLNFLPDTQV